MDNLNIRQDNANFEFTNEDIHNVETLRSITRYYNGYHPGSLEVMREIYKTQQDEDILIFLNKIWKPRITGLSLWHIYKNECNCSIQELLSKDLSPFTNEYFYEKVYSIYCP